MTFHHLIDASFGCMVALTTLWCAASARHWAVRWGVVTAVALASLIANAFQPVLQAISAAAIVSAAVGAWRWWTGSERAPRLRSISVRDLMLATGYCAVVAAVASRTPEFQVFDWGGMVGTGLAIAMPTLLAGWLVFGRGRWWRRLLIGGGVFLAAGVAGYGLRGLWFWLTWPRARNRYATFSEAVLNWFSSSELGWQAKAYGPTLVLGVIVMCVTLIGARRSGWFGDGSTARSRTGRLVARSMLVVPVLLIAALNLTVLWELTHPTPIPPEREPIRPNGWDDIVAAGAMISEVDLVWQKVDGMSEAELTTQVQKWAPVYAYVEAGLNRNGRAPSPFVWLRDRKNGDQDRLRSIQRAWVARHNALTALRARATDAEQRGDTAEELRAAEQLLHLRLIAYQSAAADDVWQHPMANSEIHRISRLRNVITADRAWQTLELLARVDARWPAFDALEQRQRVVDENNHWSQHLSLLLDDWSGIDHYAAVRYRYNYDRALMRMVLTQYALRLCRSDHPAYPERLASLIPEYLEAVPTDPFDGKPLRYRRDDAGYTLYSVGRNGVDDGGDPMANAWSEEGDLTLDNGDL